METIASLFKKFKMFIGWTKNASPSQPVYNAESVNSRASVIKDGEGDGLRDIKTKNGALVISESNEYKVQVNQFGVEVYKKLSAEERDDISKNPQKYLSESEAKLSDESTHKAAVPYDVDAQMERLKQAGMAQEGADISRSPGGGSEDHIGAVSHLVQNVEGVSRRTTIAHTTVAPMSKAIKVGAGQHK